MNLARPLLAGALALAAGSSAHAQTANPIVAGVQACALSAAPLPGGALTSGIVLKADASNSGKVYVGGANVTIAAGYPLAAGEAISYGATSLSMIYMVCANTTDVLHFTGN